MIDFLAILDHLEPIKTIYLTLCIISYVERNEASFQCGITSERKGERENECDHTMAKRSFFKRATAAAAKMLLPGLALGVPK